MKIIEFILTKKMYLAHNFQSSIWLGKNNLTYKKNLYWQALGREIYLFEEKILKKKIGVSIKSQKTDIFKTKIM